MYLRGYLISHDLLDMPLTKKDKPRAVASVGNPLNVHTVSRSGTS